MAKDLSLPLREAIVTHLKDDGDFTTHVPEGSIYGMRQAADATWPFTRYGAPDTRSFKAQCIDGSIVDVTLHVFSKDTFEDECAEILAAMSSSLDGVVLALPGGARAHVRWKSSQILADASEASAWHGLAHIEATIVS